MRDVYEYAGNKKTHKSPDQRPLFKFKETTWDRPTTFYSDQYEWADEDLVSYLVSRSWYAEANKSTKIYMKQRAIRWLDGFDKQNYSMKEVAMIIRDSVEVAYINATNDGVVKTTHFWACLAILGTVMLMILISGIKIYIGHLHQEIMSARWQTHSGIWVQNNNQVVLDWYGVYEKENTPSVQIAAYCSLNMGDPNSNCQEQCQNPITMLVQKKFHMLYVCLSEWKYDQPLWISAKVKQLLKYPISQVLDIKLESTPAVYAMSTLRWLRDMAYTFGRGVPTLLQLAEELVCSTILSPIPRDITKWSINIPELRNGLMYGLLKI